MAKRENTNQQDSTSSAPVTQTRRRMSDYGNQLAEKQKTRLYYGMSEKQFHLTFKKALKMQGDAGKNFLRTLESRLDNTIFRLGFADSRAQARQLVNHGHFTIDDRKANIPSMIVKSGQIIKIKKSSQNKPYFRNIKDKLAQAERPAWLNFNIKDLEAKVLHEPHDTDLPEGFNVALIIEYYSK